MFRPCANVKCPRLIERGQRYCPGCAPAGRWGDKGLGTNRTGTAAHKKRRGRILQRDPMCQLRLPGCTGNSTVLDHIVPLAAGSMVRLTVAQLDTDENCRGICQRCSDKVSAQQGHWFAGHRVECPWTAADVERLHCLPSAPPPDANVPRRIELFGNASARGDHARAGRGGERYQDGDQHRHGNRENNWDDSFWPQVY